MGSLSNTNRFLYIIEMTDNYDNHSVCAVKGLRTLLLKKTSSFIQEMYDEYGIIIRVDIYKYKNTE